MQAVNASQFKALIEEGYYIIDTRKPEIFCDGFIEESVSVPFDDNFITTLNDLTEPGQKIVVVTDPADTAAVFKAIKGAATVSAEAFLEGGFAAWSAAGYGVDMLISIDADEFAMDYQYDEFYLVDIRSKDDFAQEHAEDAENIVLNDLEQILTEFDTADSYYVYGNTAAEAITAASVFKKTGFNRIRPVAADYEAIKATKIPFFKLKKDKAGSDFSSN